MGERKLKLDIETRDFLENRRMIKIILDEFKKSVEGERDTCLSIFLHLACIWVKNTVSLPNLMVNSESSAGKSYICKQIVKIFPENYVEYRTKISPEAFTYWHNSKFEPDWTWNGKICYLEDVRDDLLNSPTFKVMASEGSIATIVINQRAVDIKINGKPVILVTTADAMPKAEILNRFSIINLDESPEQTKRIKRRQIEEAITGETEPYSEVIKNALKELVRVDVRLPEWVKNVGDYFPDDVIRIRRDFPRFIDLIKASAALHQYQREFDPVTKVVWADENDYENARKVIEKINLSGSVFGLTHRLRKAFELCLKFYEDTNTTFCAKEMFKYAPMVSEKWWKNILDKLAKEGLLTIDIEDRYWSKKPVTVYKPKTLNSINLPPFSELLKELKE